MVKPSSISTLVQINDNINKFLGVESNGESIYNTNDDSVLNSLGIKLNSPKIISCFRVIVA